MSCVWAVLILSGALTSLLCGKEAETAATLLGAGREAIEMAASLCGTMMVWGGLMEILRASGDMERLGRGLKRLLRPVMRVSITDEAWSQMGMNLSCNMLGLGNAATPFGLKAARVLADQGTEGLRALAWLLVLNDSSLELFPATVIALRREAGSLAPGSVWLPTLAATTVSTVCAVALMALLEGRDRRRGRIGRAADGAGGGGGAAGDEQGAGL